MQHRLKSPPRPTEAEIISAEFLDELLAAADNAIAAFHLRFGREPFTALATDLESIRLRGAHS
jgi:hypothetical protein